MSGKKDNNKYGWNKADEKNYKWLYNILQRDEKFKKMKLESYLNNITKTDLLKTIKQARQEKKPDEKLSDYSKKTLYFMASKWYRLNDPSKTDLIEDLRREGYNAKEKTEKKEMENEMDEQEAENYRDLSYFKNIVKSINYDDLQTKQEKERYILLALMILQPPIRTGIYPQLKISITGKFNETDTNYLWTTYKGKPRAYFYIQLGKVKNSEKYKKEEYKLIEIEDKFLVELLNKFINDYPQNTYLFENKDGNPISTDKIRSDMRKITGIPKLTIDNLRSIHIIDLYNKKPTHAEKLKLSEQMMNSVEAQSKYYFKRIETQADNKDEEINLLKNTIAELQAENAQLKTDKETYEKLMNRLSKNTNEKDKPTEQGADNETKEDKDNNKDNDKNNKNKSMDAKYRHRQADQLLKLNRTKDAVKNPKESTLKKYNIKVKTDEKGNKKYYVDNK